MTVEYTIVPADYGAYASYAIAKEPTFRIAARKVRLGFAVGFFLTAALALTLVYEQLGGSGHAFLLAGVSVTIIGLILTWRRRYEYRNSLQQAFTRAARLCLDHPHSIEADSEGLHTHCVISDCRITWAGVRGVSETPKHVFVLLQNGSAFIIPCDRVVRGDLSAIVSEIRTSLAGRGA
jgi:hypothetical protein